VPGGSKSLILQLMAEHKEIEIKLRVSDLRGLTRRLRAAGFHLITRRTHEMNTIYDFLGLPLRKRGELLRLRKYGSEWVLTHKTKGTTGRHKARVETESRIADGTKLDAILHALGFRPTFRYEKFRAEWSDGKGHVVVDQTPIGNFAEIEGAARWIDQTARTLKIEPADFITQSYIELFFDWKKDNRSPATEMTFQAISSKRTNR
jgi:adenylate cyclase class 2